MESYPSITEELLLKAINFAKQFNTIQDCEKYIIIHAKRTVVFKGKEPWRKKGNNNGFDVTMGRFDGAESCELVVCYMLSLLQAKHGSSFGLYRDDGLGIVKGTPRQIDSGYFDQALYHSSTSLAASELVQTWIHLPFASRSTPRYRHYNLYGHLLKPWS